MFRGRGRGEMERRLAGKRRRRALDNGEDDGTNARVEESSVNESRVYATRPC